jgi:hypothetical protein
MAGAKGLSKQSKNFVDSNVYFRVAREIHPLLARQFGKNNYCLYIIEDFEDEYFRSCRLKSTFYWVTEEKYVLNRKKRKESLYHGKIKRVLRTICRFSKKQLTTINYPLEL